MAWPRAAARTLRPAAAPRSVRFAALVLVAACAILATACPAAAQGLLRELAPSARPVAPAVSQPPRTGAQQVGAVEAELVADHAAAVPGGALRLGLRLRHPPDWHTYWRNPGDSGLPTELALSLPPDWSAGPIEWPAPQRIAVGPLANYGYEGEIVLPVTVQVPADAPGEAARVTAHAQWLVCREVCVPGEASLALDVPLARAAEAPASRWLPLFEAAAARTPHAPALPAQLHVDGGALSIVFASDASAAEFFPYAQGVVKPSGAQVLQAVGADRRRLDMPLADEPAPASVPSQLAGVLVADGRPYEVQARLAPSAAPAGERIGVALARGRDNTAQPTPPGGWAASSGWATSGGWAASGASLAVAIASGLAGGLLLNLMPCVFPVIGLKLMGFAQEAAGSTARMRRQAWAFAAGIVSAFCALAALLLVLRAAGESVGWGFQLQSPGFVAAMALLFVAIGLNFSGVYEVGVGLTRLGPVPAAQPAREASPARRAAGAFGAGLLATLVATPCTAPFMGSAVGFTLGQPPAVVLAVMAAVGVGMAWPYVALAYLPALARRLPRPGRWMESFRQFLAFPMYATAAWLAWVLGQQAGVDAMLRLMIAAVLLSLAAWSWGRFARHGRIGVAVPASLAAALGAAWLAWSAAAGAADVAVDAAIRSEPAAAQAQRPGGRGPAAAASSVAGAAGRPVVGAAGWAPYDDARLQALRAQGRTVFVDFTAAWCISCQVNEKVVLDSVPVRAAFARQDVALLRADWTRRDADITRALAAFGRNGVPLYLVYRPGREQPTVLPELLTSSTVLRAIDG